MTEVKIGDIPRHKIKHSHTLKVSDTNLDTFKVY